MIVHTEEVLIVLFVLILWVGAIALFFHRWGKIRMLEPYQPKFQQAHRPSCPLVDLDGISMHNKRMSMQLNQCGSIPGPHQTLVYSRGLPMYNRPRQNSVFVGPNLIGASYHMPPRKTRSAVDLHQLVLNEESIESVWREGLGIWDRDRTRAYAE